MCQTFFKATIMPGIFTVSNMLCLRQRQLAQGSSNFCTIQVSLAYELWQKSVLLLLLTALTLSKTTSTDFYNSCKILAAVLLFEFQIAYCVGGNYFLLYTFLARKNGTSSLVCFLQCGESCVIGRFVCSTAMFVGYNKSIYV